jgi:hypothetical protein
MFSRSARKELRHPENLIRDIHRLGLERFATGEAHKLLGQPRSTVNGLLTCLQDGLQLGFGNPPVDHLHTAGQCLKEVVEVVTDTGGELADGLHLLETREPLLSLPLLRDVNQSAYGLDELPLAVPLGGPRPENWNALS